MVDALTSLLFFGIASRFLVYLQYCGIRERQGNALYFSPEHIFTCLESIQIHSMNELLLLLWILQNLPSMFFGGLGSRFLHEALGVDFIAFPEKKTRLF